VLPQSHRSQVTTDGCFEGTTASKIVEQSVVGKGTQKNKKSVIMILCLQMLGN
jgi:hypothetical protein